MSARPFWRRAGWYSWHGLRAFGAAGTIVLGLCVGLALWLFGTEAGLRQTVALVTEFSGGRVEVAAVEGRLVTPLALRGVRVRTEAAEVEVAQFELRLDWLQVGNGKLFVHTLAASDVHVQLKETPPDEAPAPASGPPDLRLPVGIFVRRLTVADLRISNAADEAIFELAQGEFSGRWNRDDIRIEPLRLQHREYGDWQLAARATVLADGLRLDSLTLDGSGTLSAEGLIGFTAQAENDLKLQWQGLQWPLQGAPQIASPDGSLSAQGTWSALRFDARAGLGPQALIAAEGQWSPQQIEAQLSWAGLADFQDPANSVWRSRSGALNVTGVPDDYRFELQGELVAREIPGRISAEGRGNLQQVTLDRFELRALQGVLRADGEVRWTPAVTAALSLRGERLDPSLLAEAWPGSINLSGTVEVDLATRTELRYELAIEQSRLRDRALSLDTQGRYVGDALTVERFELQSGRTQLSASGRATPPFDLSLSLDSPNLEALWPELQGSARLQASLRGALPLPQIEADGRFDQVAYRGYGVERAELQAALDPKQSMSLQFTASGIEAVERFDRLSLTLDGPVDAHRLDLDVLSPRGEVRLGLAGAYQPRAQRWDGQLDRFGLAPSGAAPWQLEQPAALRLSASDSEAGAVCLAGDGGRACLQGRYTPKASEASVELSSFMLEYLRPLLPQDYALRGEISGRASARLEGQALAQADVALDTGELQLRFGESRLLLRPSTVVASENAVAGLDADLQLNLSEGQIRLLAQAAPGESWSQRALRGELQVQVPDLKVLERVSPEISEAQGSVEGRFALGGTLGLPSADGALQVADGSFRLETPGIVLSELKAQASGSSAGQMQFSASAVSGGGAIEVSSELDFTQKPIAVRSHIGGQRFQALNTPAAKVWIDPNLDLVLNRDGLGIRGELGLPQALITPERFKSSGAVSPSSDQVILGDDGQEPEPALPVQAEVTLKLGDSVRFEGYGLKSRFAGAMTLIESPGKLTSARGQIKMVDGQYKAYGQDLTIETGRLIYSGGPVVDPAVEIKAYRKASAEVTVGVNVRGTLDQPQFSLYSDPSALTQQEQLSWLVLGRPLSAGGGDDAALASAALSLGLKGGQWFAKKFGGGLQLDEISVGSEPGESAEEAQLTIGKYLSPKLYVSYGVSLFQPGHTFKMRYDLGRGFAVETESGVYSGGDLLYSVEK